MDRVRRATEQREFEFPVTVDWNWREGALRDWWLIGPDRSTTSVTFVLDKSGLIR